VEYTLLFPLIPLWLVIDAYERGRAKKLIVKMDHGYVPNWWDEITCTGWERY